MTLSVDPPRFSVMVSSMEQSADVPRSRIVSTEDVLRALPYHSPMPGWHAHGVHLIPTSGCAACAELRRRRALDDSLNSDESSK